MPVVTMPDGTPVTFPDNMPPEQIRGLIESKFPDAAAMASAGPGSAAGQPPAQGGPGYMSDVAQAVPAGLARGVAGLAGLPGDVREGMGWLMDFAEKKLRGETDEEYAIRAAERDAKINQASSPIGRNILQPTSSQVRAGIENNITGPLYKPQTGPGKVAGTISEFVPAALAGPGSVGRKLVNLAVIPGAASEGAGYVTEGTPYEPYARAGAAIAAGGAASILNRPATAERALRSQLPANIDDATITSAENLMREAQSRGVALTWAEALEQVAPGTGLVNTQRLLESSPGGREIMGPFMAQRPAQVQRAATGAFGEIAPATRNPSTIGPAISEAAGAEIQGTRQAINAAAKPYYDAAAMQPVSAAEMARVRALPGYDEARVAIRNDPQLSRYVAGAPENSVGFLNEVKKYLGQAGENAAGPMNVSRNMQRAAGYSADESVVRETAARASRAAGAGEYETALAIESRGRSRFLEPLMQGPIGKLAASDTTTKNAIDALFPANPLAGSAPEISRTVAALARRTPTAARQLVRAHLETTFNEATQALQGGANQFGGARFASVIAGNRQQRANLEAAVDALTGSKQTWRGFERFLNVLSATGTRQPIGSRTAFNAQELRDLSTGGVVAGGVKLAASPNKLLSAVSDAWGRWQLGRNMDQLARIITDPEAGQLLRRIAAIPPRERAAQSLAARIVTIGTSASTGARAAGGF